MRFAVDGILQKDGKILLIRRAGRTFHNYWALPGGILEEGETVEEALTREMLEELGVEVTLKEILGVYSKPNRDPREHTISVTFICDYEGKPEAGDDAVSFGDFEVGMVPELELAFDHKEIIRDYRKWLEKKGTYWSTKE
ncbi:MAG: NUDIX hydrolase [Candidatus Heimdallarchaeota archaeon]|nr:MAG: NUDIX hydrolase [Candidatus Heimdallarchaeota archaeon]